MKLATLLYIKNDKDEFLLIERLKEPNKGLLSPPGGKLSAEDAETPFACAVREAHEECGIISSAMDWTLIGIVTEKGYPGIGNIMVFLLQYKKIFNELPEECSEGKFHFYHPDKFSSIKIPRTDKLYIWKFVLNNMQNFFSIHIDCTVEPYSCKVESEL